MSVEHTCRVCGAIARYGYGPPGQSWRFHDYDRQMVWLCRKHRPDPVASPDAAWQAAQDVLAAAKAGAP